MNIREERKRKRLNAIKQMLDRGIKETETLTNILIVNFAITKRTALEEINAVKFFEEVNNEKEETEGNQKEDRSSEEESASGNLQPE